MPGSERRRELRRRRQRKKKIEHLAKRVDRASSAEKALIAEKIRNLTPGADVIIQRLSLED